MSLLFTSPDLPASDPDVDGAPVGAAGRWLLVADTVDGRRIRSHPAFHGFEVVDPDHWFETGTREPGLVVLDPHAMTPGGLVHLLSECIAEDGWVVAAWRGDEDLRVLNASPRYGARDLVQAFDGEDGAPYLLDLRRIMKDVSHARHDLNNPLTSALAETQLLLMDEPGGEVQASLETVQHQLRRLRDLIKLLSPIRLPG